GAPRPARKTCHAQSPGLPRMSALPARRQCSPAPGGDQARRHRWRLAMTEPTTLERLDAAFASLSPAERTLTAHLRRNHPVAGLASITALARAAGVSTPTVVRLVQKVGFKGYPDFQAALRGEVEAALLSPLA